MAKSTGLFRALALLIVAGIAGAWALGPFGAVAWRTIDLVRLLAVLLFLIVGLVVSSRSMNDRRKFPFFIIAPLALTPITVNSANPVVETAAVAVILFTLLLIIQEVLLRRRGGDIGGAAPQ